MKIHGNKGRPKSEEWKRKMSELQRGRKNPLTVERNRLNKGKKQSKEQIEKRRKKLIGNKSRLGQHQSIEERLKKSLAMRGDKCHWWRGGISKENLKIRMSFGYKLWREAVFKRDNWTCVWCGQIGGKLNADHIKPFRDYPELRLALDNGRTLCVECHRKTDTWGFRKPLPA